jgi:hypothetical protein
MPSSSPPPAQPGVPWVSDDRAVTPYPQPSFVGWPTPAGYVPPYAPLIDWPSLNTTEGLCSTVASAYCSTTACMNGVRYAIAPYFVDDAARLALDAGSPEFVSGFQKYNACAQSVMGGTQGALGPNTFI